MKNKKNKKAEIATFLTLGMILVGAVLTVATSFFANKAKNLASNPRAACDTSLIPSPDAALCFCQKGKVRIYASSTSRKNNCMTSTPEQYGNAYGADNWGWCPNNDTSKYTKECSSTGSSPPDSVTATPSPPNNCTIVDCSTFILSVKHTISKDNNNYYYDGKNCDGEKKIGEAQDVKDFCSKIAKSSIFKSTCREQGKSSDIQILVKIIDENNKQYCANDDPLCNNPQELENLCAEPKCESIPCADATGNSEATFNNTKVYRLSNNPNVYYTSSSCEGNGLKLEQACSILPSPTPTPNPLSYVTYTVPDNLFCGESAGLISNERYRDWLGNVVGDLLSFATKCINKGNQQGLKVKIVITDKNIEGNIVNDYMHCCTINN
jgi:hypothetical protein